MSKEDKQSKAPDTRKDDVLFTALGKSKKRKRRKIIITVVCVLLVFAIAAVITVGNLRRRVQEQFASNTGDVLSYQVSTGTISTVVSGSGTLTDVDLESITVPEGVEITEVLVETNDAVTQGGILATVDMASVRTAMADLQAQIEALDAQISEAESDEVSETVRAGVSGRVKVIYAEEGAAVTDTMYEHGALALISMDGHMAVDIETDSLGVGDTVTVVLSGGEALDGTVETVSGSIATVLVTDDGPEYDEAVAVLDGEGAEIGSGRLYIHSALRVTGYGGTVKTVRVELNDKVSDSTRLFTLEDTGYTANYASLLRDRGELEETLLELLAIQRDGAVLAPVSGSVHSVDYEEGGTAVATLSIDESMSVTISVDEADILSLELGQQVEVTVSSVSGDAFAGTLTEINKTAENGYYSAVVTLDKVDGMLSGMTADASVRIEGVDNALVIPIDALNQTRDGAYVYTSYNEQTQEYGGMVDVVTGLQNSNYVEIKSGLNAGDTVYYTKNESIFDRIFGNMGNMGGMDNMGYMSGENFSGGNFGGRDFSEMPGFSEGGMPEFSGGMPVGRPGQ